MRISGGTLRGRTVVCPPGVIRPAMDRMRESLFSIIDSRYGGVADRSFLDLFSGSGLVGLEAYSRGARPVVLVERDRGKRQVILRNCHGLEPPPVVRMEPVERFLDRNRTAFDVVYLDPPFDYPYKSDLLQRLAAAPWVRQETLIIIHAPHHEAFSGAPETGDRRPLLTVDQRDYGGSRLTFLVGSGDAPDSSRRQPPGRQPPEKP